MSAHVGPSLDACIFPDCDAIPDRVAISFSDTGQRVAIPVCAAHEADYLRFLAHEQQPDKRE